jgi:hypothetical protein
MYAEKQPVRTPAATGGAGLSPSATAAHNSAAGKLSKRISRTRYVYSESLSPAQRTALVDQLYEIYCETARGDSRDVFEALVFGANDVRIALFYGPVDELAGYSYVATEQIDHANRTYAVQRAGVFWRLGYGGGLSSMAFGLTNGLRYKFRHPRIPLAYLTRSTTPAVYRLLASLMPRVYPSPKLQTPDHVLALLPLLSARRGYVPVGGNPWVVREDTSLCEPSRLRRLDDDPYARFYTQLNPRFADGESVLTWVPLDLANIASGLFNVMRKRLAR